MIRLSKKAQSIPLVYVCLSLVLIFLYLVLGSFYRVSAEPVIEGYKSDKSIERSRVVALEEKDKSKVILAPSNDPKRMFGIVVDANDAPVTLTSEGQDTFVATTGRYEVLVSTANGVINPNDYITLSNIDGIGAKATEKQLYSLGKAINGFDGKKNAVTIEGGITVGRVYVDILIGKNPISKADRNLLPDFLRKAGETVAGKPVSNARLYTAFGILITSAGIAAALIFSGVRNAMISIGRNPLGRKSIYRGMIQVVVFSIIIFIIGIIGVYLLLKV